MYPSGTHLPTSGYTCGFPSPLFDVSVLAACYDFTGTALEFVLGILCAVSILAGVVALVGHGLWLFIAWLFRNLTGAPPAMAGSPCFSCHNPRSVVSGRCRICGAPADVSAGTEQRADLFATRRQLGRWLEAGKLAPETYRALQQLLEVEHPPPKSPVTSTTRPSRETAVPPVSVPLAASAPSPFIAAGPPVAAEEIVVAEAVEVHPLDRIAPSPLPERPPASAPRRAFADMLQAFMEQKNIRWVELLSGLLIVGCATGLVISLRAALKDKIPYFPALSFMLVTGAFHAAGIYSLRRWNLKSTSRGVLIIATLLVPLSILAAIILAGEGEQRRSATDPVFLTAVVVGLLSFGTMNYFASRALVRHGWWRMMLAVLGTSIGQLIINRLQTSDIRPLGAALIMLPAVGSYLVANLAHLFRLRGRPKLVHRSAQQFFLELGVATFAVLAPIGLFIAKAESATVALRILSPVLSLGAASLLASGLFAHRRFSDAKLGAFKTTGTGLALLGAGLMLLMVAFAWPQLPLLIAVGLLNFVTLTLLATVADLALLNVLAVGCLALAYLGGFHLWQGLPSTAAENPGTRLMQAIFTGRSGGALAVFTTIVAGVGVGFLTKRRREIGLAYLLASVGLGSLCIAIAGYAGFWGGSTADGNWSTVLFGYFAVAALVAAWFTHRSEATWLGSALILAGTVHGLWLNDWLGARLVALGWTIDRPVLIAVLLHSTMAAAGAALAAWGVHRRSSNTASAHNDSIVVPLSWSALATSVAATPFAFSVLDKNFGIHAAYLLGVSVAWLMVAVIHRAKWAWCAFQVLLTVSLVYFTKSVAMRQSWWTSDVLYYARHIHWQFVVLAGECIGWVLLRRVTRGRGKSASWMPSAEHAIDQVLLALLVAAVTISAVAGCLPGVWNELGMSGFQEADSAANAVVGFVAGSAWMSLAAILTALGVALWERRSLAVLLALVFASATVPLLLAGRFFDQHATASAARWLFALFGAGWCVPACYFGGPKKRPTVWIQDLPPLARPADVLRVVSLLFSVSVVIGLTTAILVRVASGATLGGPNAESYFARMGSSASYATPLAILMAALYAYAVRESRAGFACAASLVFQYFISLACLLPVLSTGGALDAATWAKVLQWNGVGFGLFTCVWGATRRWIEPGNAAEGHAVGRWDPRAFSFLSIQIILMLVTLFAIAVWVTGEVVANPTGVLPTVLVFGRWPSYFAIVLAAISTWWLSRRDPQEFGSHAIHFLSLILVAVVAATVHGFDTSSQWWAYHALVTGWMAVAAIAVAWMCWRMRSVPLTASSSSSAITMSGVGWGALATILSGVTAWTNIGDVPSRIWETAAACGAVVVTGVLGVRSRLLPFAYASIACAGFAALLFHFDLPAGHPLRTRIGLVPQFSLALLAVACVWLGWEVWFQRRGEPGVSRRGVGAAHRLVAHGAMIAALIFVGLTSLHILSSKRPLTLSASEFGFFLGTFAAFFLLQFGLLWDHRGRYGTLGLYIWLLMISVFAVDLLLITHAARTVALMATLATQVAVTGWIWSWGGKLAALGGRFGMFDPIEQLRRTSRWLIAANLILSIEVLITSTVMVLAADARELRVAAACLPLLVAAGIAGIAQQHRRDAMQLTALLTASWGAALLGWSDIVPDHSTPVILARAIRLLMAWAAGAFVLGVIVVRMIPAANPWRNSSRRAAVILAGGSIVALLAVLGLETMSFQPGIGAPVSPIQIAAVSIVLVGLIATLISLAVLPGRDPLQLTERGRMVYVYGAQVVAALLFAHIYLTIPRLFHGILRQYWPYIVLLIAFAGVGVGTLFERLRWRVLAEPFQRSGAFLPLIPALSMWFVHSESNHSLVLFVIGVLYMLVSFSQKSVLAGVAAAVAGNGALWSLLNGSEDLSFASHPQFWLIPPAISAMVAAQLNRDRLSDAQLAAIRYEAMGVIYISSSVEMLLIIGIGESLWPPVILICLALLGVAFGIAMQIRAYLYLGSVFVLVSLVSMVAHASRSIDHVWPWWAFGIGMGILILVVFGYFEGRRTQILALIDRLRQWKK